MRTNIPEKLLKIADDISEHGNVNLTRLVALKKWFEKPERLAAFAVWVAARATSRKGKTIGTAAELFRESKALLAGTDTCRPQLERQKAQALHDLWDCLTLVEVHGLLSIPVGIHSRKAMLLGDTSTM